MRRLLFLAGAVLLGLAGFAVLAAASERSGGAGTYKIELDNAFGLVPGAALKIAGVPAGTITGIGLDPACVNGNPAACRALVTVRLSEPGLGPLRSDAFCQARPQSLIGEYFVDCQPGRTGAVIKPGATIPVTRTASTIPADLLLNVMRLPYRQRLALIINELGAAVAGRSGDLRAALHRAVPVIDETDRLLNLLAGDSRTPQALTVNADAVATALAAKSGNVERFITDANRLSSAAAAEQASVAGSVQHLPGFLEQLRPAMQQLGAAVSVNEPVLVNLDASAAQLDRLLADLPGFSRSALPAIRTLGQASVTGKRAVQAAKADGRRTQRSRPADAGTGPEPGHRSPRPR